MFLLPTTIITAPVGPLVTTPLKFIGYQATKNLTLQANFIYGSGGTTLDGYVQTTFDGGATWADIAQFHYASVLASLRSGFNLSSLTPFTTTGGKTFTDGTLAAGTAIDGFIGSMIRFKYASTGTFAGGTALQVVALSNVQLSAS